MKKILTLCLVFVAISILLADDVTDSINEGLKLYKDGDYAGAMQSLDYASQLIKQKKGTMLEDYFPEPLSGWEGKTATSSAANQAFLGGGINAEREYNKGESSVYASIMSDSPLMSTVMMMISNPMFATSDGGKMVKINGEKALVKYDVDNKSGEIQMVVAGKYLVQFSGSNVSNDDLMNYAKAMDYQKLVKLQ